MMRAAVVWATLWVAMAAVAAVATVEEERETAFVQTEDELHFFGDAQQMSDGGFSSAFLQSANAALPSQPPDRPPSLNQLNFHPTTLTFGDHAIGVPFLAKVRVQNPTASKVRFDAISGSTVHFHCSFFAQKNIEPGGETTFDVVFLPRTEGALENTLLIHSSLGAFSYSVLGTGKPNPYRLRPIVGARIPLNGTLVSALELHNPHPTTLKVTEMYTSGGDLHLELPDGTGGAKDESAWEIPPYQTKTVMKAKFLGARERNTTAYIRIKTGFILSIPMNLKGGDFSAATDALIWAAAMEDAWPEPILLPVEVEVTSKRGLFSSVDVLNFGHVINDGPSKVLDIRIVSSLNRTVEIDSVTTDPTNPALKVNWEGSVMVKSSPDLRKSVSIGRATFWGSGVEQKEPGRQTISGHINVVSRGGFHKLAIPYTVQVITGKLEADSTETSFFSGLEPPLQQNVSLQNTFPFPVAVYNISVPKSVRSAFSARLLSSPLILGGGGDKTSAFTLRYNGGLPAPLTSFLRIYTNISTFDIPLHVFDGKLRLTLYSIEQTQFDFGVLDEAERRAIHFAVTNENPVGIPLNQLRHVMDSYTHLKLLGMEEGNETILNHKHKPDLVQWEPGQDLIIPANSFAVFEYSVVGPGEKALYQSSMTFQTPYELKPYPVTFHIEEGSFVSVPEKIVFLEAFPGKLSQQKLQVYNSYGRSMPLLRLSTLSHDPRIFFESFREDEPSPVLKTGQMSFLGRVFFFPIAGCNEDCYVGMPLHTNAGKWFVYGMKLPANLAEIDVYLYQQQRAKWKALQEAGEDVVNSTIVVDTTEVKHFQIPARGQLVWPRLMKSAAVHFPLTAVGNFSIVNLTLQNPSSQPVVVQLLPLTIYPDPELLLELLKGDFESPLTENVEYNETLMFTLRDTELFNLPKDSPVPRFRQEVEEMLGGMAIPRFTLSMLLPPGWKVRVRVGFLPKDYELRSSLLLIRNNLTVLEPVTLYGRGARMGIKINNREPGRKDRPLLIELRDQHLADCNNPKRQTHRTHTSLTVWHPFYMVNTGEVPFTVIGMNISNHACENHGFRILNCETFHLRPNQTREIKIAFTADFTSHWTEASLQVFLWGNSSASIYPLAASIPEEWLPICHSALPRHPWEPVFYYMSLCLIIFCTICCVAVAFIEGDRIIITALRRERQRERELPRFDLNGPASRLPEGKKPHTQPAKTRHNNNNNNSSNNNHRPPVKEPEPGPSLMDRLVASVSSMISRKQAWDAPPPPTAKSKKADKEPSKVPPQPDPPKATLPEPPKVETKVVPRPKPEPTPPPEKSESEAEQKGSNSVRQRKSGKQGTQEEKPRKGRQPEPVVPLPAFSVPAELPSDDSWEVVERPKRNATPLSEDGAPPPPPPPQPPQPPKERPSSVARKAKGKAKSTTPVERKLELTRLPKAPKEGQVAAQPKAKAQKKTSNASSTASSEAKGTRKEERNSPYNFVAKLTADVVNQTRQSPYGSESEESGIPEWDSVSVANESLNYDDAFQAISSSTRMFAKEEDHMSSSSRGSSSSRDASGSSSPAALNRVVGVPKRKRPGPAAHKSPAKSRPSALLTSAPGPPSAATSPIGPPPGFTSPLPGTPQTPEDSGVPWSPGVGSGLASALRRSPGPLSMMQKLQLERKARLEAWKQERRSEEDWPGVALAPVAESLWDEEHEPWGLRSASPLLARSSAWSFTPTQPSPTLGDADGAEDEDRSSGSLDPSAVRLERPNFKWNVAAEPFKPIQGSGESGGESSPRPDSKSPAAQLFGGLLGLRKSSLPPSLDDPSILGWAAEEPSPPSPSALASSLFAGISTSIWDPTASAAQRWPSASPEPFAALLSASPAPVQAPAQPKKEPKKARGKKAQRPSPKKKKAEPKADD